MNINPIAKMKKISKALKLEKKSKIDSKEIKKATPIIGNNNKPIIEFKKPVEDTKKFKLIVEDEEESIIQQNNEVETDNKDNISADENNMNFDEQYNTVKLNEAQFFNSGLQTLNTKVSNMRRVICFPDSILLKVQTVELQNCLIGQLARILCLYKINEVIIIHDHSYNKIIMGADPADFMLKVLQYLETPQYLRKKLFPLSPELKFVGLVAPLECHHHLKQDEMFPYREGVVIKRPVKENTGSWVDVGLLKVN